MLTEEMFARAAAEAGLAPMAGILRRLDGPGPRLERDPGAAFYPASMIKTPLALAALALAADGALALSGRIETTAANMTLNDKPSPLLPGYETTIEELLLLMLTRSDNVATNMLYDVVGRQRAGEIVRQRFGLSGTAFHRKLSGSLPLIHDPGWDGVHLNTHPPRDAARLFELIARTEVPFAALLRGMLGRQEWNNKLSAGLRPGDAFAHKTGDTDDVTHDGGILETAEGASYVIVVYAGIRSSDENNARFGTFMSALRPLL